MHSLEESIYDTIAFFDMYRMPVTATQVWQRLVVAKSSYAHHPSLRDVQKTVQSSDFLRERIETKWGYYCLRGKSARIAKRLARHAIAQEKWKIVKRCARFLAMMPFVRLLAGSGSLAVDNTKYSSDLDMLVVAKEGRIWTTRLFLLLASALLGKRRSYRDQNAPDMLCLNHYITDRSLAVSSEIRNVCMAMQYGSLVPIYNESLLYTFLRRNMFWIDREVRIPARLAGPLASHQYTVFLPRIVELCKDQLERLLLEPLGDSFERFAELLQRHIISRHKTHRGRIVLSYHELAFHPDTKIPALVEGFLDK